MHLPTPIFAEERQVFCNRTLNMRNIHAIGYDMDYTLIHYHVEEWERRAYDYLKQYFVALGWPVQKLEFNSKLVCRGLIIDSEQGNLLKANRFGYVKQAMHGLTKLSYEEQRKIYSRTIIDLSEKRWIFLNTLFSLSEGCLYAQLVDMLDQHKIPAVLGYVDLYERVKYVLETAHMEGQLKADIIANPSRYVQIDDETSLTLLDQYHAGKRLMLITNSEWNYTAAMMDYSFNRYLPNGKTWKDLFDLIVVSARKPHFFTDFQPIFEVIDQSGCLVPCTGKLKKGTIYLGGSARQVENYLGLSGDEILYVGDHMFGDVHVSKNVLRWRTALIVRELEDDILAEILFKDDAAEIKSLMTKKEAMELQISHEKLKVLRMTHGYGPSVEDTKSELEKKINSLKLSLESIDLKLAQLASASSKLNNPFWGLLMRAGNDKSYLAYQLERYADIYTSRVSNLSIATPFAYLRSPRGSLPHDPNR